MAATPATIANLIQVVPFLGVADMERSVRFYIDGLGFAMARQAPGAQGDDIGRQDCRARIASKTEALHQFHHRRVGIDHIRVFVEFDNRDRTLFGDAG